MQIKRGQTVIEFIEVVEIAFGCLKSRWRRLMKRSDMVVRNIPNVIQCSCYMCTASHV